MPIPLAPSTVKFRDLRWRGRDLGQLVENLTNKRVRRTAAAHLDPDLRADMRPRLSGWKPSLGQRGSAQGHLKKHGVSAGDLFLFWGLFRHFDEQTGWASSRHHAIWGWLQVADVVSVDETVRGDSGGEWRWAQDHPHLAFESDPTNTLYVAAKHLSLPGIRASNRPGAGAFDFFAANRQLTAGDSPNTSTWALPPWFLPGPRPPLSFNSNPKRWTVRGNQLFLKAASRGQEFILEAREYPEAIPWAVALLAEGPTGR